MSGKVHHTVYKPRYEAYILDTVTYDLSSCHDGDELPTRKAKIKRLLERLNSEYGWRVAQVGKQKAIAEWLSGLALPIACYNGDIIDMAIEFGSIDPEASDKLQDKVIDGYWSFMANIICGMEKEVTS
jgi:hypothetical protein